MKWRERILLSAILFGEGKGIGCALLAVFGGTPFTIVGVSN